MHQALIAVSGTKLPPTFPLLLAGLPWQAAAGKDSTGPAPKPLVRPPLAPVGGVERPGVGATCSGGVVGVTGGRGGAMSRGIPARRGGAEEILEGDNGRDGRRTGCKDVVNGRDSSAGFCSSK